MCREEVAARENADQLIRSPASHDGQSTDVFDHHLVSRITQCAIVVHDNRGAMDDLTETQQVGVCGIEEIASRHHSREVTAAVEHGKALMRRIARS
jgi:hypothetical protein